MRVIILSSVYFSRCCCFTSRFLMLKLCPLVFGSRFICDSSSSNHNNNIINNKTLQQYVADSATRPNKATHLHLAMSFLRSTYTLNLLKTQSLKACVPGSVCMCGQFMCACINYESNPFSCTTKQELANALEVREIFTHKRS